jgi:hypothetical protein
MFTNHLVFQVQDVSSVQMVFTVIRLAYMEMSNCVKLAIVMEMLIRMLLETATAQLVNV